MSEPSQKCPWYQPLCKVTSTSKILAAVIFIILPFVGGYVGYQIAYEEAVSLAIESDNGISTNETSTTNLVANEPAANISDFMRLADGESIISDKYQIMGYRRLGSIIDLVQTNGDAEKVLQVSTQNPNNFWVSKDYSIYAHDETNVYVEGKIIPGADIASFKPLVGIPSILEYSMALAKDSKAVYVYTNKLEGVDLPTFVSLGSGRYTSSLGLDKSSLFQFGLDYQKKNPLKFKSGEIITFRNTENVKLSLDEEEPRTLGYSDDYNSWYDMRFGLFINRVSYLNLGYLSEDKDVYSMYDECTGISENRVCKFSIERVDKIGEIPASILKNAKEFGLTPPF